jgi:YHS domain-containing protein
MLHIVRRLPGLIAATLLTIAAFASIALAQQATNEIFQARRADYTANALAVGGFDTVAYHTQRAAVPGNANFRVSWKGAEWHFASQENRDLFVRDPDRYAPQYGGWCAFAVAAGVRSSSDPRLWDVVDGKLYLNQSSGTQSSWRRDQAGMIQRGDQNWPRILAQR